MEIEWKATAKGPTDAEIDAFEQAQGVRLTSEHRWFLQNIANGGRPVANYAIPTTACPGGAAALHSVYGIGRLEYYYDLGWALGLSQELAGKYFPFGSDEVGGDLMIDLIEHPGRLVYNPSDPSQFYHSAHSIRELLATLVVDVEEDD